ncbi:uncharacterized protein [Pleurodeles waltl]
MKAWAGRGGPGEGKTPSVELDALLPRLLSSDPGEALQAVEGLLCALQGQRARLLQALLGDPKCHQYLDALSRLLAAPDVRLCSNIAYILGTIAEDEIGTSRLVLLAERPISKDCSLLGMLAAMLKWDDSEAVMNAAGTLGTLAETCMGQQLLLKDPQGEEIIENITLLLDSSNEWTASNAALVLARLSMCQEGCAKLLEHTTSDLILKKLITSLQVDEAGCGMNAAFAIGRLCGTDSGLKKVLSLPEAENMIVALELMMAKGDAGGSRNACFALSCLAEDRDGHSHILKSPVCSRVIDTLCRLLQSEEQESSWFAAMTVRVLANQPMGVVKLREHPQLEKLLKKMSSSNTAGKELLEEVTASLLKLQRLPRPHPPTTKRLSNGSIKLEWNDYRPLSGLQVIYRLFERDSLLYHGRQCSYVFSNVKPGKEYCFTLSMETEGDHSPHISVTVFTQEESVASCPLNLRVIGRTTSQLKLIWAPPAEPHGVIKGYTVCRGDTVVESTQELSCIVGGLTPDTSYTFSVCACTSKGRGEKAFVEARTTDTGEHAPGKLSLYVVGRSEIFITWDVPKVPLGRFFNYELCLNGKVVYLGTERTYTARRLTANTEYTCTVSAITSEGRCESRPVTRRTAKDEYENINKGYSPMWSSQPATAHSTQASTDSDEKPAKTRSIMTETYKRSPVKILKNHILISQRANRPREDDSAGTPVLRSRRNSSLSWSTESSSGTPQLLSEAVRLTMVSRQPEPRIPLLKGLTREVSFGGSRERNTEASVSQNEMLTAKSVISSTMSPAFQGQYGLCTLSHPMRLTTDTGKGHKVPSFPGRGSFPSFPSLSVAIFESLGPEYLVQHRAKTESELLRGPQKEKQEKTQKWKRLDKASTSVQQEKTPHACVLKTTEPGKDSILLINRRNLRDWVSKQDPSEMVCQGTWPISEPELPRSLGRSTAYTPMKKKVLSVHLPKDLLLKDHLFSQARASFQGRLNVWSQLQPGRLLQTQPQRTKEIHAMGKPRSGKQ